MVDWVLFSLADHKEVCPLLHYIEATTLMPHAVSEDHIWCKASVSFFIIFLFSVRGPTDNSAHVYTGQWSELKEKDLQLYKQMRTPTASLSSVCRSCEGHSFVIWLFGVMDQRREEICQSMAQ